MLKYLRIAVTALSFTACVLLVVLWVRSYYFRDATILDSSKGWLHFVSMHGRVSCSQGIQPTGMDWSGRPLLLRRFTEPNTSARLPKDMRPPFAASLRFDWKQHTDGVEIVVPYWSLVLVCIGITATVGFGRGLQFSLRTLLIATTLIAVGLGTVIYLAR